MVQLSNSTWRDAGTGSGLQQLSSLFFVTFVLGLLPFVYMTMFMADRQFFSADPAGGVPKTLWFDSALSQATPKLLHAGADTVCNALSGAMYHPLAYYAATAISHTLVTISNGVVVTLIVYSLEGAALPTSPSLVRVRSVCGHRTACQIRLAHAVAHRSSVQACMGCRPGTVERHMSVINACASHAVPFAHRKSPSNIHHALRRPALHPQGRAADDAGLHRAHPHSRAAPGHVLVHDPQPGPCLCRGGVLPAHDFPFHCVTTSGCC